MSESELMSLAADNKITIGIGPSGMPRLAWHAGACLCWRDVEIEDSPYKPPQDIREATRQAILEATESMR